MKASMNGTNFLLRLIQVQDNGGFDFIYIFTNIHVN